MLCGMQLRYRYRLDPTPAQRQALACAFGCARVVYNDGLRLREDAYRAGLPFVGGVELAPSPVTRLHRAIALRYISGPRAAMTELDTLAGALDRYHLYHATRAELLRELGHPDRARAADRLALELTANPAEQAVLQQRITWT
jgi:transposase